MNFDVAAALRRLKPDKRREPLARRPDHELPLIDGELEGRLPLLLDTSVYIDLLNGRAPMELDALLEARLVNHSSIALGELSHLLGRLDPAHPGTSTVLRQITATIQDIPARRLTMPSVQVVLEAGIVTGMLTRLAGSGAEDRRRLFNDACLFLHARETGAVLLSANVADMDLIDQLVPGGRMLLYRGRS